MEQYQDMFKVYGMLQDDLSKKVYLNRLLYSASGSKHYLMRMINESLKQQKKPWRNLLANERLIELCDKINMEQKPCRIALFGAAWGAITVIELLYEYGILANPKVETFFVDNDVRKQGTIFEYHNPAMRLPIYSPQKLDHRDEDLYVLIAVNTWENNKEIYYQLFDKGIPEERIFCSIPGYEYNVGNIYFEKGIMVPQKGDVFCDIGAYDMWNTEEFIKFCPEYDHVYAFEADPVSFKKCRENIEEKQLSRTEVFNYGVWSNKTQISFESAPDGEYGGSRIDTEGSSVVQTVALDEFLSDKKVSIIKMDIEGAELEALKGARNIIQKQKPCLAVSVYHKKWDILELPLYIQSLNPGYKFYMRHHTFGIWDTVLYAVDEGRAMAE